MTLNYVQIGKRIQKHRKEKKITQETLANMVDLSVPQISYIENGKSGLSLESLVNIATVLDASVDEILFGYRINSTDRYYDYYVNLMTGCSDSDKQVIIDTSQALKKALEKKDK